MAAMNVELPTFKHGEPNSESVSTFDRDIIHLKNSNTCFTFSRSITWLDV